MLNALATGSARRRYPGVRPKLVGRLDRLGERDLRFSLSAALSHRVFDVRVVGEETLKRLHALPFIDRKDESIPNGEPVMDRAF